MPWALPMGIVAGRELFGYTRKDCTYAFDEKEDCSISSWVNRSKVPVVRLVDGLNTPAPPMPMWSIAPSPLP